MSFTDRKVHPEVKGEGKTGSFAELSDGLAKNGYSYQYKAGQESYSQSGIAIYINESTGKAAVLIRIAKGKEAKWLPRPAGNPTSWLAKTAATPDKWQLITDLVCEECHSKIEPNDLTCKDKEPVYFCYKCRKILCHSCAGKCDDSDHKVVTSYNRKEIVELK